MWEADSLYNSSCVADFQSDPLSAHDYANRAVSLYRTLNDRRGEFRALNVLGVSSRRPGDTGQVCPAAPFRASLAVFARNR